MMGMQRRETHRLGLTNTMGAILGLQIGLGIPVTAQSGERLAV
jgi:hypothetical protein